MGTDRDLGETRLYLVRYTGEVTTKGRGTRIQFLRRLESHVREGLESTGLPFEVDRQWSRMLVEAPPVAAEEILPRIFGVHSISPTVRREGTSLEGIVEAGTELFRSKVAGKLFAVRARRSGERKESFRSGDVNRALGSSLLPFAEGVDLEEPEIVVRVEIRNGSAYFFEEKIPGPGGLPLGCEGPALALVSGGFDSAVASWAMLRRGARLDYLFCNLGGTKHRQGALQVMKLIADRWSHGSEPRLHEVDLRPLVEELRERCRSRYWQILLKRLMLHAGNHLARELRSEALVTGEVLGQVSSQTLRNLRVISEVAELPVLRPLAGRDKDEIVDLARRIGTYDLSAEVPEFCALDASKPATRARPGDVRKEEEKLDLGSIAEAVEAREVFDLRSLDASTLGIADLGVETPPPDARIVDVRSRTGFDAWHLPGAEHVEYFAALDGLDRFQGDRPVVFYCEVGLKSAHLAELLRDRGIEAYHFEAGLREVLRHARKQDEALTAALSPALLTD